MTESPIEITQYTSCQAAEWDKFVRLSKNGTFLFLRDFMDYHADRFEDHSLILRRDGTIVALLPANRRETGLQSHGGLTYGGFVTGAKMSAALMLDLFSTTRGYMAENGLTELRYKPVPHIYHAQPAEEDLYALFRENALLDRCDISATINIQDRLPFSGGRKDGLRKARREGLEISESTDWPAYWRLLSEVLAARHEAQPTHSLAEIEHLAARFPEHIRLFGSHRDGQMLAGVVTFDCGPTIHAQYIASSPDGQRVGGVDAIIHHLLEVVFADRKWFDFGISTTEGGRVLNEGLMRQKEMFGARATVYQQFLLSST